MQYTEISLICMHRNTIVGIEIVISPFQTIRATWLKGRNIIKKVLINHLWNTWVPFRAAKVNFHLWWDLQKPKAHTQNAVLF